MKKLLIVKCGGTIPELAARKGDFEDWITAGAGIDAGETLTVDVEKGETLPAPTAIAAIIVTGSHAMVTDRHPWSERTAAWLAKAVGRVPILGICYGHQLLGHALGGRVADNPNGREMGVVPVTFTAAAAGDPLLGGFVPEVLAPVSHRQSLLELPAGAVLLARSAREPHQAVRFGDSAWGVQFHPEFDAGVAAAYIDHCREDLAGEGQDPDALRQSCVDAPAGSAILRRFREIFARRP